MAIETVIPNVLYRSDRPGHDSKQVGEPGVAARCAEAKGLGINTIICLLDDEQLTFYSTVPGGLLGYYRQAGFDVIPRPTEDHVPVPEAVLSRIFSDFLNAEKAVVVHCSAGRVRTGEAINYLLNNTANKFRALVENLMREHAGRGRPLAHFLKVTQLAVQLYDLLESKHQLPPRYRTVLWSAAILHDIGTDPQLGTTPESHAWRSADKILEDDIKCHLASALEIATVASLHSLEGEPQKGALGKVYERINSLWPAKPIPREILILAGILRVADGFDRGLDQSVKDVQLEGDDIVATGSGPSFCPNVRRAQKKGALLTELIGVRVADADSQGGAPFEPLTVKPKPPAPVLFFDFLGTIIHHETMRAMPMLPFMIRRLQARGCRVVVLTSFEQGRAQRMAAQAGLAGDLEIHSTQNRGQIVGQILRASPATERAYYIDDKPEGLASVLRAGLDCLKGRILGFTGSRKHCATEGEEIGIALWCQRNRVPLALSPYDILCHLREDEAIENYAAEPPDLSPEELGLLIPGLAHPFSVSGGDAEQALGVLVWNNRKDWTPIWENLGWIGGCECQCKIMIRSALLSLGMDAASILSAANKAHEHIDAVHQLPPPDQRQVKARLNEIRTLMNVGLTQIGAAAEDVRPAGNEGNWERNRMQRLDREFLLNLADAD